ELDPELDPWHAVRTPRRNHGPARLPGGTYATPLARRLAAENGIDLAQLSPSGPHGRLVAHDVETALARLGRTATSAPVSARGAGAERVKALYAPGSYEEIPVDGMRRTIAERLIEAKQTIPHFYLSADVTLE